MKKIDRLQFLQIAGGILGAGVATAAAACGGDDAAAGAACNPSAPTANISQNHGHSMTVTAAEVVGRRSKTYSIKGSAPHDHMVSVSDVNFQTSRAAGALPRIRRPAELTVTSTRSPSAELLRRRYNRRRMKSRISCGSKGFSITPQGASSSACAAAGVRAPPVRNTKRLARSGCDCLR